MSIFASKVQRTIDIPFGDRQADGSAHTVTIQKLSAKQVARAREAGEIAMIESVKRMGGAQMQRELSALGDKEKQAELIAKAQADPLNPYDRETLIRFGLKASTYGEVTQEAIDDLSEEAADFIARAIVELTLPKQDEASRKNGSGPFIASSTVTGLNQLSITTADSAKNSAVPYRA